MDNINDNGDIRPIDYESGTEWLKNLPEQPCPERDQAVLDAVSSGLAQCAWLPITNAHNEHTATFYVCDDAVYVNAKWDVNGQEVQGRFRFQVNAVLAQKCADLLEACLPTTKICDLAYQQANVVLNAQLIPASPAMVTTTSSKLYNSKVEKVRNDRIGIVRDCGKAWLLSNSLGLSATQAINYGYYDHFSPSKNSVGISLWQTLGTRHDRGHSDHSQTLILMLNECVIDGIVTKMADIYGNAELAPLFSYEGVLKITRQPGA